MTPTSVQANHTSAVGQMEAVNFTIIPTSMAAGCHIQVRQTRVLQALQADYCRGKTDWNVSLKFDVTCLRVLPCLRPGSACSITAPTTATFATSWKAGTRRQSHVHAEWHLLSTLTNTPHFLSIQEVDSPKLRVLLNSPTSGCVWDAPSLPASSQLGDQICVCVSNTQKTIIIIIIKKVTPLKLLWNALKAL